MTPIAPASGPAFSESHPRRRITLHRNLIVGVAAVAASMTFVAAPALADTIAPIPLSFNHVVLDTPGTGAAQLVTPSTAPLSVVADVDTTTGAFSIDKSSFSAPTYSFKTPVPGTASMALAGPATGTVDPLTGAMTMTGDFLATINLGADGSCTVNTGSKTLSTAAVSPLLGSLFPASLTGLVTGKGAFGTSWLTLPASSDGTACTLLNGILDGPGGLWISRSIAPSDAQPAHVSESVAKKATSVRAGKSTGVKVTLTNSGDAAAKSVKVCLKPTKGIAVSACQTVKALAANSKHSLVFKVSTKKSLKAGSHKLTLTATGLKSQTVTVKVTH
jgi:hypothetical protein